MKRLLIAALCLIAVCCGPRKSQAPATRAFPEVKVPSMLYENEAAEYLAMHFWDEFLDGEKTWLCDSAHIAGVDCIKVEEKVGLWATVLGMLSPQAARSSTKGLTDRMEACLKADSLSNIYPRLTDLISRYLYDPNSPVRNEDAYWPFAEGLSKSSFVPKERKNGYAFEARMCALNATLTPAADFRFTDQKGRTRSLYSVKAPLTLLFFSNPGCPACKEIMGVLTEPAISEMVSRGDLAVVNVYIDEELDKWREYVREYPSSWYTGYDKELIIRSDLLYNVRAIPSLYLLDKDKKVLLKDAPVEKVMEALYRCTSTVDQEAPYPAQ